MESEKIYQPYKKTRGTMVYTPTNQQMSKGGIVERVVDIVKNIYWAYYVHLPYYLMTPLDAFCLHTICLVIVSLSLFGLLKYLFL
ncbi:protein TSC3 [Kluyveromyces marxianus]|uniref:Protein TSC3 n=1 Tax=Kluyveromyces marxianus TaxID=4911 RepID=A0ABX6EXR3_KLUMA|nr:protein TSC3 [Kluyveromyces marxianus]